MAISHRDYRRYFVAEFFSHTGTWMQGTALPLLVLARGGGAQMVGAVIAARYLPSLLYPVAGRIADRHDKRRVIALSETAIAIASLAFMALALWSGAPMWTILVAALTSGVITTLGGPAHESIPAEIVGDKFLSQVTGLASFKFNVAKLTGPLLAGAITAAGGLWLCFALNAVSSVVVAVVMLRLCVTRAESHREVQGVMQLLRSNQRVVAIIVPFAFFCMFGPQVSVLLPMLVQSWGGGPAAVGAVFAIGGVGGVLAAFLATVWGPPTIGRLHAAIVASAAAMLLCAASGSLLVGVIPLILFGGACTAVFNATCALLQSSVQRNERGAVMAAYLLAIFGCTAVSSPGVGWMIDEIGAATFAVMAGLMLLTVGLGVAVIRRAAGEPARTTPLLQPTTR